MMGQFQHYMAVDYDELEPEPSYWSVRRGCLAEKKPMIVIDLNVKHWRFITGPYCRWC